MLNKVFLGGRATRDIELRRTSTGTPLVQFSLAVENRINKDENGKPTADFVFGASEQKTNPLAEQFHLPKASSPAS